jgi:hypothetical protein
MSIKQRAEGKGVDYNEILSASLNACRFFFCPLPIALCPFGSLKVWTDIWYI